ncbi:MAG: DNA repair protein RadC [Acidobacteria bacterium]|nr:DNA repair protein RadC [Acidobacteriota bacterium]
MEALAAKGEHRQLEEPDGENRRSEGSEEAGRRGEGADGERSRPEGADGHRRRLRERFLAGYPGAMTDAELLELLLTFGLARKDTRGLARETLARFGSLSAVLGASLERLREVAGIGDTLALLIRLVRAMAVRSLEEEIRERRRISSPADVADYLCLEMGHRDRECVLVLCLDSGNRLVSRAVLAEGTVNQAPVYPREVARIALAAGATAVLLAHNHPGGQCQPSADDLQLTRDLKAALEKLDVQLHDHLVVAGNRIYSIAAGRAFDCRENRSCASPAAGVQSPHQATSSTSTAASRGSRAT